jgi:hypothetical protein
MMYPPKKGKWTSESTEVRATVVTPTGSRSTGRIINWIGPAECELDTGVKGVLLETHLRRGGV